MAGGAVDGRAEGGRHCTYALNDGAVGRWSEEAGGEVATGQLVVELWLAVRWVFVLHDVCRCMRAHLLGRTTSLPAPAAPHRSRADLAVP